MKGSKLTRTALRRELRQLSRQFAEQLFETLERYGVWDDLARRQRPRNGQGARGQDPDAEPRVRRSEDALLRVCDEVVAALRGEQEPVAISTIARNMGVSTRRIAHPLALLVARGAVIKTGERRGARYALVPTPARRAKKRPRLKATTRRTVRRKGRR